MPKFEMVVLHPSTFESAVESAIVGLLREQLEETGCPVGKYFLNVGAMLRATGRTPRLSFRLAEDETSISGAAKPGDSSSRRKVELILPEGVSSWEVAARLTGKFRLKYADGSQHVDSVFAMTEQALCQSRLPGDFSLSIMGTAPGMGVRGRIVIAPDNTGVLLLVVWPEGKAAYGVVLTGKSVKAVETAFISSSAAVSAIDVAHEIPAVVRKMAEQDQLWKLDLAKMQKEYHAVLTVDTLIIEQDDFPHFTIHAARDAFKRAKERAGGEHSMSWSVFKSQTLVRHGRFYTLSDQAFEYLGYRALKAAEITSNKFALMFLKKIAAMDANLAMVLQPAVDRKAAASAELDGVLDERGQLSARQAELTEQMEELKRQLDETATLVAVSEAREQELQQVVDDATTEQTAIEQAITSRPSYQTLLKVAKEAVEEKK